MLSAFDVINDLWRSEGWDIVDQLEHALEFIDALGKAESFLFYLEGLEPSDEIYPWIQPTMTISRDGLAEDT